MKERLDIIKERYDFLSEELLKPEIYNDYKKFQVIEKEKISLEPTVQTYNKYNSVLDDIEADDLALYFREFEPYVGKCKFGMNCRHITEPDCAVRKAVEEGAITPERYDSWQRISEEIRTGSWSD